MFVISAASVYIRAMSPMWCCLAFHCLFLPECVHLLPSYWASSLSESPTSCRDRATHDSLGGEKLSDVSKGAGSGFKQEGGEASGHEGEERGDGVGDKGKRNKTPGTCLSGEGVLRSHDELDRKAKKLGGI